MTDAGARLTSRGRGLVAVAVVFGVCGYLFGLVELYPVGMAALVLVVAARASVVARSWDVRVSRVIRPARVPDGSESRVLVSALNLADRRSPVVMVSDRFENGEGAATFGVAPLQPGETRAAGYRLAGRPRGVYRLLPLEVALSDPFGLAQSIRRGPPGGMLTVHPRVDSIPHRSVPSDGERDRRVPLPHLGRGGDDFYGLREYQTGDDLRQVHWASTARTDELMIRQPENLWRGRTTIAVDARQAAHTSATFEAALSAAASLASSALRAGLQVRLVATGGTDTGFGAGNAQEATILDTLARVVLEAGDNLAKELLFAAIAGPVVLLTTDAAGDQEIGGVLRRAGRCSSAVAVFHRTGRPGGQSGAEASEAAAFGRRTMRVAVPPGGSFAAVWGSATVRAGRGAGVAETLRC